MKDESRIIANTLVSYVARFTKGLVAMAMVPYLLKSLGDSTYGIVGIANSILQFLLLIECGIRPAVSRQFTRFIFGSETKRANELVSTAFLIYQAMAALMLLMVVLGGGLFLAGMNVPVLLQDESVIVLIIVTLAVGVSLVRTPFESVLVSHLRFDICSYVEILTVILHAVFVVTVFHLWEPRLLVWAWANILVAILSFFIIRSQAYRQCDLLEVRFRHVSRRGLQDIAGFGMYTAILRLSDWVTLQSGPIIISYFLGTTAVAHYSPAAAVVVALQPFAAAFLHQLYPVIAKAWAINDWGKIQSIFIRSTRYSLLVSGGLMAGMSSVAFCLVPAWLGKGYEDTCWALFLWAASRVLISGVLGCPPLFVGTGKLRVMTALDSVLSALSVFVAVGMVPYYGIVGVVFGVVVSQAIRLVVWFTYSAHIFNIKRIDLLKMSYSGPIACLAVLITVSALVQYLIQLEPFWELAWACGITAPVYLAMCWKLGLDDDDRKKALFYWNKCYRYICKLKQANSPIL